MRCPRSARSSHARQRPRKPTGCGADRLGGRYRGRAVTRDRAEMPGNDCSERPASKTWPLCSDSCCVTPRSARLARRPRPAGGSLAVLPQPLAGVGCSRTAGTAPSVAGPSRTGNLHGPVIMSLNLRVTSTSSGRCTSRRILARSTSTSTSSVCRMAMVSSR